MGTREFVKRWEQLYAWRQEGKTFREIRDLSRAAGWKYGTERIRQLVARQGRTPWRRPVGGGEGDEEGA